LDTTFELIVRGRDRFTPVPEALKIPIVFTVEFTAVPNDPPALVFLPSKYIIATCDPERTGIVILANVIVAVVWLTGALPVAGAPVVELAPTSFIWPANMSRDIIAISIEEAVTDAIFTIQIENNRAGNSHISAPRRP
jgi:hypothetical protein